MKMPSDFNVGLALGFLGAGISDFIVKQEFREIFVGAVTAAILIILGLIYRNFRVVRI